METTFSYIRSWMAVPLTLKEQVIGMLTLSSLEPDYYTPRHAALVLAIANQAAVALENARLYEQAQELAALEERQRLARELHDSVSQALYGITLGTWVCTRCVSASRVWAEHFRLRVHQGRGRVSALSFLIMLDGDRTLVSLTQSLSCVAKLRAVSNSSTSIPIRPFFRDALP